MPLPASPFLAHLVPLQAWLAFSIMVLPSHSWNQPSSFLFTHCSVGLQSSFFSFMVDPYSSGCLNITFFTRPFLTFWSTMGPSRFLHSPRLVITSTFTYSLSPVCCDPSPLTLVSWMRPWTWLFCFTKYPQPLQSAYSVINVQYIFYWQRAFIVRDCIIYLIYLKFPSLLLPEKFLMANSFKTCRKN